MLAINSILIPFPKDNFWSLHLFGQITNVQTLMLLMTITILGNPQFSYYSFFLTTSLKSMKKNPTLPFKFSWKPIYNNNSNKNKNKIIIIIQSITTLQIKKTTIQQKKQKAMINERRQITTTNILIESMKEPSWSKLYEKRVKSFKRTLSRVI